MATTLIPVSRIDTRTWTGAKYFYYDNVIGVITTDPPKVKGGIIHWPQGGSFRTTTNYGRSRYTIVPGRPLKGSYMYNVWRIMDVETSPGGWTAPNNFGSANWLYAFSGAGLASLSAPPNIPVEERNEAVTKSLNKLADQKANIGENLATFGQTARMFLNPSKYLVNGLKRVYQDKSMKPFLLRSYRDLIRGGVDKKIASKYLEYVYGLAPLMQDVYNVAQLAKESGSNPMLLSAFASARREQGFSEKKFNNVSSGFLEFFESSEIHSRTRCNLHAKLSDQYPGTRTLNQLGLVNPASLIWELVPYSFAVDWFLPIGPVLQALTAPAGLDFVDGSLSRRVEIAWQTRVELSSDYREWVKHSSTGSGSARYDGYIRERITGWPRPGLWFDPDPLRLQNDGSDRKFKALALAIMSLKRS